jgi:hypothetical protein
MMGPNESERIGQSERGVTAEACAGEGILLKRASGSEVAARCRGDKGKARKAEEAEQAEEEEEGREK